MKGRATAAAAAVLVLATATTAGAITGGVPDGGEHPYVGLMVALDDTGEPLWRCSGTLIDPTVFLTAGHCTEAPAASAQVWFDEDVEAGLATNGYPYEGDASGATVTHPDYDPAAFYVHDLGLVLLDEAVTMATYGTLPEPGAWDALATRRGHQDQTVEAVGYGLQNANRNHEEALRVRLKADLQLVDVRGTAGIPAGTSVMVSGDAARGGTCFGDSGGPLFIGTDTTVVGAVNSFALNANCAGVGGGYRIDNTADLDWIASHTP